MTANTFTLFKRTKVLEEQIEEFLTNIEKAGALFFQTIELYIKSSCNPEVINLQKQVSALENKNDFLRRGMENQLYTQMVLPDMRSDILNLLEGCDHLINKYEADLLLLTAEKPKIPTFIQGNLIQCVQITVNCVESLLQSCRCFFSCSDSSLPIDTVRVLEHQIDIMALELKRAVFDNTRLSLDRKLQLKSFIYSIEKISDMAEDVSDTLTIMAVKHTV